MWEQFPDNIYPAMLIVQYASTPSGVLSCCAFGVAFFVANISSKVAYTIRYFAGVLFHTAWLTTSRR